MTDRDLEHSDRRLFCSNSSALICRLFFSGVGDVATWASKHMGIRYPVSCKLAFFSRYKVRTVYKFITICFILTEQSKLG